MKLLVISQYFWPENFRINDLVAELVQRGHEVTVLTGKPNYPDGVTFRAYRDNKAAFESYGGAKIVRVPMLARGKGNLRLVLNYLSFALSASVFGLIRLWSRKFDAIFVFEPSPITVGLPALALKWRTGAPITFWVLDLWPQSVAAVGALKSPLMLRQLEELVGFIYRGCDLILVQSRSFVGDIARYLPCPDSIRYFPSWSENATESAEYSEVELPAKAGTFDIVFTGNIGVAQDFPAILDTAELLREEKVRWLIVGDGREAEWVRTEIRRRGLADQMLMVGRRPLSHMPAFYRYADALLVSLRDEPTFALTIPGKVQAYLAAGVPVLAMLNGEGADVIRSSGSGIAVAAGDAAALAEAVKLMMHKSWDERAAMGRCGRDFASREFNRDVLISRLELWLGEVARKGVSR